MSAETKAALDAALASHIADELDGNIVTDWCAVIASTELADIGTGSTTYQFESNDGQPPHVSYGLLAYAERSKVWDEDDD